MIYFANVSNLNRRRYAQNDDTLYVAPEDERTDYVRHLVHLSRPYPDHPSSLNPRWQIGILVF